MNILLSLSKILTLSSTYPASSVWVLETYRRNIIGRCISFRLSLAQYSWSVNKIGIQCNLCCLTLRYIPSFNHQFPTAHLFSSWGYSYSYSINNTPSSLKRHVAWPMKSLLPKRLHWRTMAIMFSTLVDKLNIMGRMEETSGQVKGRARKGKYLGVCVLSHYRRSH